ncbi:MAG: hypothetical protein ABIT01_07545 [Thermoanaerobaculia bacterium]
MSFDLDPRSKKQILEFVRPLSVSLDGMTEFGFVERRLAIVERLLQITRTGEPGQLADEGHLFLVACFVRVAKGRISNGGRTDLLLGSVGVPAGELQLLQRSLGRVETDPRTFEERLVHDALLLETVGAYGVTEALVQGTKERMTLLELAEEIESRMNGVTFATAAARELAHDRIEFARAFARRLAEEAREFEPAAVTASADA